MDIGVQFLECSFLTARSSKTASITKSAAASAAMSALSVIRSSTSLAASRIQLPLSTDFARSPRSGPNPSRRARHRIDHDHPLPARALTSAIPAPPWPLRNPRPSSMHRLQLVGAKEPSPRSLHDDFARDVSSLVGGRESDTVRTSSDVPDFSRQILPTMASQTFCGTPRVISVSMKPGQIALTVTPFRQLARRRLGRDRLCPLWKRHSLPGRSCPASSSTRS